MTPSIRKNAKNVIKAIGTHTMEQAIYTFGNGGSASIADHMACDWMKGTGGNWSVVSLSSNGPLLSAIANDMGYEYTCSAQLNWLPIPRALVLISASGNSPNVIKAAIWAQNQYVPIIGFTGFDGGRLKMMCDVSVHIECTCYGVAEDFHSQVMHEIVRMLRVKE